MNGHAIKESQSYRFQFSKYQIALTALFIGLHLTCFMMGPRIVMVLGFPQPGGILLFPFTFLLADLITEVYTYRYARFLVWCVITVLGIFTLDAWFSAKLAAPIDYGYGQIFSHYPRLYFSVCAATFVGFFVNNTILSKLKIKFHGKHLWWRILISTAIGHLFFSATWILLFHTGSAGQPLMLKMIVCTYLWKMAFEVIGAPFICLIASWLKEKEGFDAYDIGTNYNPFLL